MTIQEQEIWEDMLNVDSYLQKIIEDNDFDKWLATNYSPAGEDASNGEQWFLSNSPHEFMPVNFSKLKEQWEKDNYLQELPEFHRDYFLTVTENQTGAIIYTRLLSDDDSLDIFSYLPEIEEATQLKLNSQWRFPGSGQVAITIGFSATPENDTCVWDTEDYYLA